MSDILVVDDEIDIRTSIRAILEDEGLSVREAGTVSAVMACLNDRCPALILLDVWLDDSTMDGQELLEKLKGIYGDLPIIVMSGHATLDMAIQAIRQGADDFMQKPFNMDALLLSIKRILENRRLQQENLALRASLVDEEAPFLGVSSVIQNLRKAIKKLGPSNSRVVIEGEPGVGKESVARAIHAHSKRHNKPFIVLNCATLNPENFETVLFGKEGDETARTTFGVLEQAHGGTLLLDEVVDMPPLTQGKILHVLQDQTFRRVGGVRDIHVDVRVMVTTRTPLGQAVEEDAFREDVYHRLNIFTLKVPPPSSATAGYSKLV